MSLYYSLYSLSSLSSWSDWGSGCAGCCCLVVLSIEVHNLNQAFILFDHGLNLIHVLHAQLLQLLCVSVLIIHDDKLGFSVNVHLQGVSDNHFGHEFGNLLDGHLEHLGESLKAERLVLAGGSEEEGLKGRLLEVDRKHSSELFSLSLGHALDEGDRADVVHSCLPVGLV